MWIVALALRRPYTFIVVGILIILLGIFSIVRTPKDIFPDINIPVIAVIWNYSGLPAEEMEKHIVSVTERGLTTIVNDIEHIESNCYSGIAVVKNLPAAECERADRACSGCSSFTDRDQTATTWLDPAAYPQL